MQSFSIYIFSLTGCSVCKLGTSLGYTHYTTHKSYAVKHSLAVSGLQYRLDPVFFFCLQFQPLPLIPLLLLKLFILLFRRSLPLPRAEAASLTLCRLCVCFKATTPPTPPLYPLVFTAETHTLLLSVSHRD